MNKELLERNKRVRKNRPLIPSNILYSTYENNGVFQICFKSKGCANYLAGYCIMCDYGVGVNLTKEEICVAFDHAIGESRSPIKALLLNSFGSILDENEINYECFELLLQKINATNIQRIIFETHVNTITKEKLELIKNVLKNKKISIELGLETSNEKIREKHLLKIVDNDKFSEVIKLIHSYDMNVIVNLLVGIPFLSFKEQLESVLSSIRWCEEKNVEEIDLFPINVKPYTLLHELYNEGEYEVISHWLLIEVLNRVPIESLSKIYLAWYGNRELSYTNGEHSIFPQSCGFCYKNIMNFYAEFISNNDVHVRKKLIEDLINHTTCDCYHKVLEKLK